MPKNYLPREVRVRKIVEGIVAGKTYGKIAGECGVTPRTIYEDRQSIEFHEFIKPLFDDQLKAIQDLAGAGDKDALRYRDSIIRALLPQKRETEVKVKGEVKVSRGEEINELLERYSTVFGRILQEDDSGEPVDPTREADVKTN